MKIVENSVEVGVDAHRFYELLIDFASYPDFVPNQSAANVIDSAVNTWRVAFELSVVKKLHYVLDLVGVPGESLRWSLVEGDMMTSNLGGWTLETIGESRVRATYDMDIQFGGFVPRSVSRSLVERTLPDNLRAFKLEAERRG